MSGRSYSHYMRPQDRDGSNNHVGERGRSQQIIAPSRGRSRDRSYDVSCRHRYDDRDMRCEAISDRYHRSRSSDHIPHRSHRSRSLDPRYYNYSSTSNNSFQRNSSDSRKRPRSPDRRHQNTTTNHGYDRYSHGDGRPNDTRSGNERYPHASTRGAEKHRAPANALYRHENAENYANESYSYDRSNYRSHYYQPQSRYEHTKSASTSHERHPLAPRYSSNPALQQRNLPHFNSIQTIPELIQIAHANITILTPSSIAAFWNKMSKLMSGSGRNSPNSLLPLTNHDDEELGSHLNQIFERTQNILGFFNAKDLSQTIYSMAKLVDVLRKDYGRRRGNGEDIVDVLSRLLLSSDLTPKKELFRSLALASRGKLDKFDARGLANLSYAYALINYVPNFDDGINLFDHIAIEAVAKTNDFEPQHLSNMVWAYATVRKPRADLFGAVGDQVVAFVHLGEFNPQDLSMTVWAYATAGVHHSMLFEKIANHVVRRDVLYEFIPQNLANTVWAYATCGIYNSKLFQKVATHIVGSDILKRFKHQHLSNTVWAYARAGINHSRLFEAVANHIVQSGSLYGFKPQDFSNTVWAYATAGVDHPTLFEKMANHIVKSDDLNRFNPQDLANTVWAYATAQVSHPKLFQKVAKTAIQRKEEFIPKNVANLLWAYAIMSIIDKQLFSSFESTAAKLIDSCNNQDLVNIAWTYAVADHEAPTLFGGKFITKCVEKKDGFESKHFSQLLQWHLWQTKEKSNAGLPEISLRNAMKHSSLKLLQYQSFKGM